MWVGSNLGSLQRAKEGNAKSGVVRLVATLHKRIHVLTDRFETYLYANIIENIIDAYSSVIQDCPLQ